MHFRDVNAFQKSKEIGRSEHRGNTVDYIYDKLENYSRQLGEVSDKLEFAEKALEKIADPRLRDHSEPDKYTELGCVMNIADKALEKIRGRE